MVYSSTQTSPLLQKHHLPLHLSARLRVFRRKSKKKPHPSNLKIKLSKGRKRNLRTPFYSDENRNLRASGKPVPLIFTSSSSKHSGSKMPYRFASERGFDILLLSEQYHNHSSPQ
ncbi:hypothetical protein J6590_007961 [Homalodisca vitripennis]|nr:hypothetical protein J6590_007961 [Homalodisca vitripennis]